MHRRIATLGLAFVLSLVGGSPHREPAARPPARSIVLWAWERGEDLRFLGSMRGGERLSVAFFASMITLEGRGAWVRRRSNPLRLAPTTERVAVLRVHVAPGAQAAWTPALRTLVTTEVESLLALPNVSGIQLDFDARTSERATHRAMRIVIRSIVPAEKSFSITSIASNCTSGGAYDLAPPELALTGGGELVPMYFAMGTDARAVFRSLQSEGDPAASACRESAGFGVGEPYIPLRSARKIYFFPREAWTEAGVNRLLAEVDGVRHAS